MSRVLDYSCVNSRGGLLVCYNVRGCESKQVVMAPPCTSPRAYFLCGGKGLARLLLMNLQVRVPLPLLEEQRARDTIEATSAVSGANTPPCTGQSSDLLMASTGHEKLPGDSG